MSLVQQRKKRGWTLQRAAKALGVSYNTLNRWELGHQRPHRITIGRICEIYECTEEELGLSSQDKNVWLPEVEEALANFIQDNLTINLLKLTRKSYQYIDAYRELACILEEHKEHTMDKSRRSLIEAIGFLAVYPIQMLNLNAYAANTSHPTEEVLSHSSAGIAACWELSSSKELKLASEAVSAYMPSLRHIIKQGSVRQRKEAARLLVQALLLKTRLVRDLVNSRASLDYIKEAEKYTPIVGDPVLEVLVLRTLACSQYFAHDYVQASATASHAAGTFALYRDVPMPPMVRSYVHAGLATYQGQIKLKKKALESLSVAHTSFYAQADSTPAPAWIDHSLGNVLVCDGLAHMHLGLYKQAARSFEQVNASLAHEPSLLVEATINRVLVEVSRSDQSRDMEQSISWWKQGIKGAQLLQNELQFNAAIGVYTAMRAAWPEKPVQELQELIVHW